MGQIERDWARERREATGRTDILPPLNMSLHDGEFLCAMEPITDAEPRILMLTTMRRVFLVNMDTGEARHIPFMHFLSTAIH